MTVAVQQASVQKKVPVNGFCNNKFDPPSPCSAIGLRRTGRNLIADGRFNYSWDGENRLVAAETLSTLPSSVPRVKVLFAYDYMSRRVGKTVYDWNSSSNEFQISSFNSFVYDSWNLISEVGTDSLVGPSSTNYYVHGLDLSGTLQGAGGIGGLLAFVNGTNAYTVAYDANGNVSEYLAGDGTIAGHYEYSPFGETIVASGSMADSFAHQFSTKYFDSEIGLNYYGYRYYSPSLGRWLSRDPIGEWGGINLYCFTFNSPLMTLDVWGLDSETWEKYGESQVTVLGNLASGVMNSDTITLEVGVRYNFVDCDCIEHPIFGDYQGQLDWEKKKYKQMEYYKWSWSRLADILETGGNASDLYDAYHGQIPSPVGTILTQIIISGVEAIERVNSTEYWDRNKTWSEYMWHSKGWVQVGSLYYDPSKNIVVDKSKCSETPIVEMYDVPSLLNNKIPSFKKIPPYGTFDYSIEWEKR